MIAFCSTQIVTGFGARKASLDVAAPIFLLFG